MIPNFLNEAMTNFGLMAGGTVISLWVAWAGKKFIKDFFHWSVMKVSMFILTGAKTPEERELIKLVVNYIEKIIPDNPGSEKKAKAVSIVKKYAPFLSEKLIGDLIDDVVTEINTSLIELEKKL